MVKKIIIISFIVFILLLALLYGIKRKDKVTLDPSYSPGFSAPESDPNLETLLQNLKKPKSSAEIKLPELRYKFNEGDHYRYNIDYKIKINMGQQMGTDSEKEGVVTSLAGALNIIVYSTTKSGYVFGYYFDTPEFTILVNGSNAVSENLELIKQALMEEVLVKMNRYGAVESLTFPQKMQPDTRNFLQSIVAGAQVVFPHEPKRQWQKKEKDITGSYHVKYQIDSIQSSAIVRIEKRKLKYSALPDPIANHDFSDNIHIKRSKIGIDFNYIDGYSEKISLNEIIEINVAGQVEQNITSFVQGNIEFVSRQKDMQYAKRGQKGWKHVSEGKIRAFTAKGSITELSAQQKMDGINRRAEERTLAGKTLQDLFNTLDRLEHKEDGKLRFTTMNQLRAFMNLYPQRINEVTERILQEKNGSAAMATMIGAMELVPHTEAQDALQEIITQRREEKDTLLLIIPTLGAVKEPTEESEALLWDLYMNKLDIDISNTSVLALGAMANKLREFDHQRTDAIIDQIAVDLQEAKTSGEKILFLEALGNARPSNIIEIIENYTNDPDYKVRRSTIYAIRNISGQRVEKIIAQKLLNDSSPSVRHTAAKICEHRVIGHYLFSALKEASLNEDNEEVREQLLRTIKEIQLQLSEDEEEQ